MEIKISQMIFFFPSPATDDIPIPTFLKEDTGHPGRVFSESHYSTGGERREEGWMP